MEAAHLAERERARRLRLRLRRPDSDDDSDDDLDDDSDGESDEMDADEPGSNVDDPRQEEQRSSEAHVHTRAGVNDANGGEGKAAHLPHVVAAAAQRACGGGRWALEPFRRPAPLAAPASGREESTGGGGHARRGHRAARARRLRDAERGNRRNKRDNRRVNNKKNRRNKSEFGDDF